jgi:putative redox protein
MPTNITVKNLPTGYQTIISNGKHKHSIIADEPVTSKGTDMGFSPEDLMLVKYCAVQSGNRSFYSP